MYENHRIDKNPEHEVVIDWCLNNQPKFLAMYRQRYCSVFCDRFGICLQHAGERVK
jgi:hypothetical protein